MAEHDEDSVPQEPSAPPTQPPPDIDDDVWEGFPLDDTVFRNGIGKD
jgi:hypothetical protein